MADTEITTGSKRLSLDKNMGTNQMSVELNYICEKIDMLEKYKNSRAKAVITKGNFDLLEKQLYYMKKYRDILAQRLALINERKRNRSFN